MTERINGNHAGYERVAGSSGGGMGQRSLDLSEIRLAIEEVAARNAVEAAAKIISGVSGEEEPEAEPERVVDRLNTEIRPEVTLTPNGNLTVDQIMELKSSAGIKYPGQP